MLCVPILALVWFVQGELRRAIPAARQAQPVIALIDLADRTSTLMHYLQQERGASSGFIVSAGQLFGESLKGMRRDTDIAEHALQAFIKDFSADAYGQDFATSFNSAVTGLRQLSDHRIGITDLSAQQEDIVAYYSGLNKAFLGLIKQMPKLSSDARITMNAAAFASYVGAKSLAGRERMEMTEVLSRGVMNQDDVIMIAGLIDLQNTLFDTFQSLATTEMTEIHENAETTDSYAQVEQLREIALAAKGRLQGKTGVDAEVWFDTTTARINTLKSAENELLTLHKRLAVSIESQATTSLWFVSTVAAVALAAASLLAIMFMRIILCQLGSDPLRLLEVVEGVARGDLQMDLSTEQPATGVFAAIQTMQANLRKREQQDQEWFAEDRLQAEKDRERAEKDRLILEDSTRLKSALDAVKTNVMMADENGVIIYCNDTLMEMLGEAEDDIRNELPNFDTKTLVGSSFDIFHKNPAHQRALVESLTSVHVVEITVSRHNFRFVATPVFDADGRRLGTVVEWSDRTHELAAERDVQMMVDSVLQGDLSKRVDTRYMTGFSAVISNGVNGIVDKLSSAMSEIRESSDTVHAVAGDIAQGNGDISERTVKQASSLEETSASMEKMTGTIRKNAEDAASASKLAKNTRDIAEQGGEVVNHAIAAMEEIDQSSRQIAAIIGVINDISFQTNLLALNASVEAARAGEQGRGFAVIASEVRNLASACAEAAQEIEQQIGNSVAAVEKGNKLVNESAETLSEIVTSVRQVTDIVAKIAEESEQQSRGVDEINMAIAHMGGMTQQNAELVDEMAVASQNMRTQADMLNDVVSNYKVGDTQAGEQRHAA